MSLLPKFESLAEGWCKMASITKSGEEETLTLEEVENLLKEVEALRSSVLLCLSKAEEATSRDARESIAIEQKEAASLLHASSVSVDCPNCGALDSGTYGCHNCGYGC